MPVKTGIQVVVSRVVRNLDSRCHGNDGWGAVDFPSTFSKYLGIKAKVV
jgi:hypothetical protein